MNNLSDVNLWASIANSVNQIMSDDPLQGTLVVLVSMGVFFGFWGLLLGCKNTVRPHSHTLFNLGK